MSSGYVTTNVSRAPERTRPKAAAPGVLVTRSDGATKAFSTDDLVWSNPITSFRSGPSYERAINTDGAIFTSGSANELFASINGDTGHSFSMRKVTVCSGDTYSRRPNGLFSPNWDKLTNPLPSIFTGAQMPFNPNTWLNRAGDGLAPKWDFVRSDSELETIGSSFVKQTNPIQSQVNLLSSIAEAVTSGVLLPELLGKTIVSSAINATKRRELIRATGSEYLNFIFGYKPLAEDIAKTGILIDTVNGIIDQWIKDSGTIVRRRRKTVSPRKQLASSYYNVDKLSGFGLDTLVPGSFSGKANPTYERIIQGETTANNANTSATGLMTSYVDTELTFSAGYSYDLRSMYLPVAGGSAADLMHNSAVRNELKKIAFGLDSGSIATAAYDATPFSWLLDWFVNLGDVIDNFRGLQTRGVQLVWGYVTETAVRESFFESRLTYVPTGDQFFHTNGFFAQKAITRIRATPFGFGTKFGSLSVSQGATLAALAASKSR